jgi:hypothetical protein
MADGGVSCDAALLRPPSCGLWCVWRRSTSGRAGSMPQLTLYLASGGSIRQDVEPTITISQLRERIRPVWHAKAAPTLACVRCVAYHLAAATNPRHPLFPSAKLPRRLPLRPHSCLPCFPPIAPAFCAHLTCARLPRLDACKLIFVRDRRKPGLHGFTTAKVELSEGSWSLQKYGVPTGSNDSVLITVMPVTRLWGLQMLEGILLDDVQRCQKAADWHPRAINWTVKYRAAPDGAVGTVSYGDHEYEGYCLGVPDSPPSRGKCVPKLSVSSSSSSSSSGGTLGPWWEGDTALHIAVRHRAAAVCAYLVRAGANLAHKNCQGLSPLDEALAAGAWGELVSVVSGAKTGMLWQTTPRWGGGAAEVSAASASVDVTDAATPRSRGRGGPSGNGGAGSGGGGREHLTRAPADGARAEAAAKRAARAAQAKAKLAAAKAARAAKDEAAGAINAGPGKPPRASPASPEVTAAAADHPVAGGAPPPPQQFSLWSPDEMGSAAAVMGEAATAPDETAANHTPKARVKDDPFAADAASTRRESVVGEMVSFEFAGGEGDAGKGRRSSSRTRARRNSFEHDEEALAHVRSSSSVEPEPEPQPGALAPPSPPSKAGAAPRRAGPQQPGRPSAEQRAEAQAALAERKRQAEERKTKAKAVAAAREQRLAQKRAAKLQLSEQQQQQQQQPEPRTASEPPAQQLPPQDVALERKDAQEEVEEIDEDLLGEYECVKKSLIRAEPQLQSPKVGVLARGTEVTVTRACRLRNGTVRCRLTQPSGWVSMATADGEPILEVCPTE